MPVMDEFKEEREALKHGTWKQKISYFFYYYKWHVVVIAAVLFFIVSFIVETVTRKDTALYACLLNAVDINDTSEYVHGFAEYAGINEDKETVILDTSIQIDYGSLDQDTAVSTQKLMVYMAGAELDVMVTDSESFETYANDDYFYDLREFLSPEQIKRYESSFYYVDLAVVEQWLEAKQNVSADLPQLTFPDPKRPEEMERPVPVGIYLQNTDALRDKYYFQGDDVVISVFGNAPHPETTSAFIDYLMQ